MNTWGNDFYTAPLATRSVGDTFRIMAAYDGTDVYRNGALLGTLNRGKFFQIISAGPLHITSTRPVFVAQYANSGDYDGNTNADPFMVTVQATRHYANSYRVCTPTNDFPTNYVCVIAPSNDIASITIDGSLVSGPFVGIGTSGYAYSRTRVAPGSHYVLGKTQFACYIYGWAEYDSYAHPGCFYFGDVVPPHVNTTAAPVTASVDDYPNTPGFVPSPDLRSTAQPQDNCSPELPIPTQTPRPGALVPPGQHLITLSVADSNGNIGETNISFTVLDPSPVVVQCPGDIVVNCQTNGGAYVDFKVTAHSTYDTNVTVVSTPPSGSFFTSGSTVVTNIATSLAGESDTCYFTVTVVCDTRVNATRSGNGLTISWTGNATLETANSPAGPWRPVTNGVTSYLVPLTGTQSYFRVKY